jgi:hypothetical protein
MRGNPSNHFFFFGVLGNKETGTLLQNPIKSATELPEVMIPDVIENPLLALTPQLLS